MEELENMKNKIFTLCITLAMLFATNSATAKLISGDIVFGGETNTHTNGSEITGISFPLMGMSPMNPGNTGDFADLKNDAGAIITYVSFNLPTIAPTENLWTFGGFSFDILSITENSITAGGGGLLTGTGVIKAEGFEDTLYTWSYTTPVTGGYTYEQSFFTASPVPAPAGIALLGCALFGFAAMRRNKKSELSRV